MENLSVTILRDQINDLATNMRFVWNVYMTWYTVFLTANMAALAYLVKPDIEVQSSISFTFLIFNILGAITSILIATYSAQTIKSINITRKSLWALNEDSLINAFKETSPKTLTTWGALANATALFLLAGIWGQVWLIQIGR